MRLHILSDLHLEFGPWKPASVDADVIVLAGDIHLGREGRVWARHFFAGKPVVYVLGNHEFYRHSIHELTDTLKRETEGSNIHILEKSATELNGFVFLGCTLWTDFKLTADHEESIRTADAIMSDYHIIDFSSEHRRLQPRDTMQMHAEAAFWLKEQLAECDPSRTIVVTHHAPSARSIPPYHAGTPLNAAFASNLDTLVESSRVPLWIHGHTHYNVDYIIGATRVLTNQRGYPGEVSSTFQPGLVLEIK